MRKNIVFLVLIAVHIFLLSQLQFTAWPEMISFPYLINHGFITYKDMIHAYPPLLINLLAVLYKIFGYKLIVLKIFGLVSVVFGDTIIFLIIKKLTKKEYLAIYGLLIYVILQPILEGNMVWPDLFIVPFLLLFMLFLINKKYFWSGIAIGLAILTKQTGVLFLGISGVWLLAYERNRKSIINFIFGITIIVLPFLLSLIQQNTLTDFINWTIVYPSKYWTKFPGYVQLSPTLKENIILLILLLPLAFLIFKAKSKLFSDKYFLLLFGFFVIGIIGVYPRFSFFHFQSALAFLTILYLYLVKDLNKKHKYLLLLIPIFVLIINALSLQFSDARFWTNDEIKLGQIIQKDSEVSEPIYLIGLNSDLYTFSNRVPNKPWLDNFGWYLEIPEVQQSVLKSFEEHKPSTVFWATPESGNWYDIGVYQPKMITNYIINNYTKVKEIEKGVWEWKIN